MERQNSALLSVVDNLIMRVSALETEAQRKSDFYQKHIDKNPLLKANGTTKTFLVIKRFFQFIVQDMLLMIVSLGFIRRSPIKTLTKPISEDIREINEKRQQKRDVCISHQAPWKRKAEDMSLIQKDMVEYRERLMGDMKLRDAFRKICKECISQPRDSRSNTAFVQKLMEEAGYSKSADCLAGENVFAVKDDWKYNVLQEAERAAIR